VHILYLQQNLVLPGEAGNTRCFEFARQWVAAGHRVTCIAGKAAPDCATEIREGVTIRWLSVAYSHNMAFWRRGASFLAFMHHAYSLAIAEREVDAVLAYSAPLSVGELGRWVAARLRVPFFFEVADVWPDVPIGMGLIRNRLLQTLLWQRARGMYKAATHIFAFSEGMKAQIAAHGVHAAKISVIYNGVKIPKDPVFPPRASQGRIEVLYAGTVGMANDLTQLVQAAAYLQAQGHFHLHFTVVGSGNDWKRVKAFAEEEGVQQLTFLPEVSRDAAVALMEQAHIGVVCFAPFPVLEANGSSKFCDYLAAGLPVVLNYEGWQAAYLRRYTCGLASPQGDIGAFAAHLLALSTGATMRETFGRNGRQLAARVFDRAQLAAAMLDVIRCTMPQKNAP